MSVIEPPASYAAPMGSGGNIKDRSWATPVVLVALVTIGAALRWWRIPAESVWYDEYLTVREARLSFGNMLHSVQVLETTPPLYFVMVWLWGKAFGTAILALRSLSIVAGVMTIPAAYGFARELGGRRAGLVAGVLVTFSPLLVWYSQEARSYALFGLLGTLSLWSALRLSAGRRRARDRWLWGIVAALLLAAHYFAVFLLVPQVLWLWRKLRPDLRTASPVLLPVVMGASLAPSALASSTNGTSWIAQIPLTLRLRQIVEQYLAGFSASPALLAGMALLAIMGGASALLWGDERQRNAVGLCVAIATLGLTFPLVLAIGGVDFVITRNLLPFLIPLLTALAIGISALRKPAVALGLTISLAAIGGAQVTAVAADHTAQRPDWQGLARTLARTPTSRVIVLAGGYRALPLAYYLPRSTRLDEAAPVRQLVVIGPVTGPKKTDGTACWWGSRCNLPTQVPSQRPPDRLWRAGPRHVVHGFVTQTFFAKRAVILGACTPLVRSRERFITRSSRFSTFVIYQDAPKAQTKRRAATTLPMMPTPPKGCRLNRKAHGLAMRRRGRR